MQGDKSGGFSVFWADDGLDTGPILLQKKCFVAPDDTVDTIYNRFLFPEGVKAMVCWNIHELIGGGGGKGFVKKNFQVIRLFTHIVFWCYCRVRQFRWFIKGEHLE